MWPYHPDLLATPVPRYTSFPTAAEFGDIHPTHYRDALENISGEASIYVHIPFCEKICFYCGCNTGAAGRRSRLETYLDALHREIDTVAALLPAGITIGRVAFGGGSPNAISPTDFLRLVEALTRRFRLVDPVYSIELDPRSMSSEWASAINTVRIRRASLGVQTFAPHCQERIGRIQSGELIVDTVHRLRNAGIDSLNFDLMYGLPGQTCDDLTDSMERTCLLGADRIALFGYAHVPHIVPRQKAIDDRGLPDQSERFAMAEAGHDYFITRGYTPVGFDHFALSGGDPLAHAALTGELRRNFQGFTDDKAPNLIGLGASAISSLPHLLAQNEKNSGRYRMRASAGHLVANRGVSRSADDRARGDIIESLLCKGSARLSSDLIEHCRAGLRPFLDKGLATLCDDRLTITAGGLPYTRTIAALFDPYRQVSPRRFSSAV
ncbi:radical SAM protein [Sphingomicrobium sp. XHP0235]|uniref:radical SAM protein n=1 Tax=Sphingomicrobium aquimarinum TaxID=3133971 RepID=UPI0031FE9F9D